MTCARGGVVAAVRPLLAGGADVDAAEPTHGQTALMWAAWEGHTGVVRALIAHGRRASMRGPPPATPPCCSRRGKATEETTRGAAGRRRGRQRRRRGRHHRAGRRHDSPASGVRGVSPGPRGRPRPRARVHPAALGGRQVGHGAERPLQRRGRGQPVERVRGTARARPAAHRAAAPCPRRRPGHPDAANPRVRHSGQGPPGQHAGGDGVPDRGQGERRGGHAGAARPRRRSVHPDEQRGRRR